MLLFTYEKDQFMEILHYFFYILVYILFIKEPNSIKIKNASVIKNSFFLI